MIQEQPFSITQKIQTILEENKLEDLKRFISKRQCLNNWNIHLIYLFHTIQSVGILTTTIGTGYGYNYLIWIGVGLNVFASLIHIFEKTNNTLSDKMLKNIVLIKNNKYIDESTLVNIDADLGSDSKSSSQSTTTTTMTTISSDNIDNSHNSNT